MLRVLLLVLALVGNALSIEKRDTAAEDRMVRLEETLEKMAVSMRKLQDSQIQLARHVADMVERTMQNQQERDDLSNSLNTAANDRKNMEKQLQRILSTVDVKPTLPSCLEAPSSGLHNVLVGDAAIPVFCDMAAAGGGWMRILRREDGRYNFGEQGWSAYTAGFGDVAHSHWLGLHNVHVLTANRTYSLRVELEDFEGNSSHAEYTLFRIGSAGDNFRLEVGGYSGDAGDALTYHRGQEFSTHDRDNDKNTSHCSVVYHGAWWYNKCHFSQLTGEYLHGVTDKYAQGVQWMKWKGNHYSLKTATMLIKPEKFH